jgi:hypothetical protein
VDDARAKLLPLLEDAAAPAGFLAQAGACLGRCELTLVRPY